ncbi:MAG: ribosome small subunit-dependent GTPase A, partial [Candidatus Zixiibacteriota bacterium]
MCNDNIYADLIPLGWNAFFEEHFAPHLKNTLRPGRVVREDRNLYVVSCGPQQYRAEVTGRFRRDAGSRADFPAVGDWVALSMEAEDSNARIHAVLTRQSCFSRKAVLSGGMPDTGGRTDEQVLAANIDTVFLVTGLDGNFSLRRIERYVAVAYNSAADPVIILNKADLCDNPDERVQAVKNVAVGVPIVALSAATGDGLDALGDYLSVGRTVAFLGSSGVGKSTMINSLLGEERLATREVREFDSKGRHTTSHRQLIVLPGGGVVIDTPGLREIQLWGDDEGLRQVFDDIESLARECRFTDCRHTGEPDCAIQKALDTGELDAGRYANYVKMRKEAAHLARRQSVKAARQQERDRDRRY